MEGRRFRTWTFAWTRIAQLAHLSWVSDAPHHLVLKLDNIPLSPLRHNPTHNTGSGVRALAKSNKNSRRAHEQSLDGQGNGACRVVAPVTGPAARGGWAEPSAFPDPYGAAPACGA